MLIQFVRCILVLAYSQVNQQNMQNDIAYMQMIDWNDIPYFLAVAESGTLLGAAKKLSVNHSTVFRRINMLEEKLGLQLFNRLPEGYSLTETGTAVLEHARLAEGFIHSFERTAAGKDYQLSGEIRISAPATLAIKYLTPCIAKFRKNHTGIKIDLIVSHAAYDLSRREADIVLRATNQPPEYLIGRKICELTWHAYASQHYLEKHGYPNTMKALIKHQLEAADDPLQRVDAYKWFAEAYPPDNFVCKSSDMRTIASLCAQNLGVSIFPSDYSDQYLVKLFKVKPEFKTGLWILTHPDMRHVIRIRTSSGFLYEYLSKQKF